MACSIPAGSCARRASTTGRCSATGPTIVAIEGFAPQLDWSDYPGPLSGLMGAVEMCNNNGQCRKFDAGAMCPSYRATRDEQHLVRGRANTIRLALTGQLDNEALASSEVAEALKLCVSCKACRRECPTGVDMAKMKIEATAARVARARNTAYANGSSPNCRVTRRSPRLSPAPANLRNRVPSLRRVLDRHLGFAEERDLPAWRTDYFRDEEVSRYANSGNGIGDVMLFADTFNRYFEPDNLRAALRVIAAAGRRPLTPRHDGRPLCCGRTYLAAGLIEKARAEARRTLTALAGDAPVMGLEPSCLMTLRDEFVSLLPGAEAKALASRAATFGEWMTREKISLKLRPTPTKAHVHGHCHQKSFGAFDATLAALRQTPDLIVAPIASSCCGMAGAFGYQSETQDVSRAMAEADLMPAVRNAKPEEPIVADGFSCRHQIADLSGRVAMHSVRVLADALPPDSRTFGSSSEWRSRFHAGAIMVSWIDTGGSREPRDGSGGSLRSALQLTRSFRTARARSACA